MSDRVFASSGPRGRSGRQRGPALIIFALVVAECVSAFEAGMVFLALPRFGELFDAPASTTGWAVTAYMLVAATMALVGGRLGDLYGRKRVLIAVLLVAALGSLVSVLGDSMSSIVIGRAIQGAAGAIMPLCYGLAREALAGEKVSLAVGFIGGAGLLAASGGSIVAGILLDVGDWHLIFLFAVMLALVAVVVVALIMPKSPVAGVKSRFDIVGALLMAPALTAVLYGITVGSNLGWSHPLVLGLTAGGLLLLVVWTRWELRHENPLINLRTVSSKRVSLTIAITAVLSLGPVGSLAVITPIIFLTSSELPVGLGLTATVTGAVSGIGALVGFVMGPVAGMVGGRWGGRAVLVASGVMFIGLNMTILLGHKSLPLMLVAMAIGSAATAFAYTGIPKLIIESVPEEVTSESTGVTVTARQAFSSISVAVTTMLLSLATVEGTAAPTEAALAAALGFFTLCSAAVVILGLFLGRARPVVRDEATNEGGKPPAVGADVMS